MSQIYIGINTALALLAAIAAFGSLNKMQWGTTRPCMMFAMALIGLGFAGQGLGLIKEEWAFYSDTALYGGVLVLLIAEQREHTWFLERWANPIAMVLAFLVTALFMLGLLSGCAMAEEQVWQRVCYEQYLGKSDHGLVIVRHFCIREDASDSP